MKKLPYLFRILFICLAICLLCTAYQPAYGQTENKFYISELDCSAFPTISLRVRGLDDSGNLIPPSLLANSFWLYENDQRVDFNPGSSENGPKYVIFSFDLGANSNLEKDFSNGIQDALYSFADNYFVDDRDTVRIARHINNGIQDIDLSPPLTKSADFENAIDSLDLSPSSNELDGLTGLDALYAKLAGLDPGRNSLVIIHFSQRVQMIPNPTALGNATALGTKLAHKNIRMYVLQTDKFGSFSGSTQAFQEIAFQSGGKWVDFAHNAGQLTDIYNQINLDTQAYRLQFRTKQLNATYRLAPAGVSAADATDSQACSPEITLPPINMLITQPSGENPAIPLAPDQTKITVGATLQDWPQDGSRRINRVELWADGQLADSLDVPAESTGTTFNLNLDVSGMNIANSASLRLLVKAVDEWGITGSSAETEITLYPPAPPDENGSQKTITFPQPSSACQKNPFTPSCMLAWLVGNLIWIMLAVLVIVVVLLFNTNRKLASLASPAREVISKGIDQVRKTLLGGTSIRQEAIAYLHVMVARADRTGGKIEIYNNRTSLGRDPKVTDVQLYHLDDESSVSSLHCTIFYEQGKFYITDDNSTNGTFVNGTRLDANEPYELLDGAEIILGDIYREGAKLRFEVAGRPGREPAGAVPEVEADFHVDIPMEEDAYPPEIPSREVEDDYRKTVPGYRQEDDLGSSTDIFNEPPPAESSPEPPPRAPAKPRPGNKKEKRDWMDDLG